MQRINLDQIDKRLLGRLQHDASETMNDLADAVALSPTACWRRIQRLKDGDILLRRVHLLSQEALGLSLTGFVMLKTNNHSEAWLERFSKEIAALPAVVEFHRMTGEIDYLLKIVAPDLSAYNQIYRAIIRVADLTDVSATFSMEQLKFTTELPLDF
ncbi:Lrp/AsnC family transcriptional regulator [Sphingomonas sp.]|uniref:Lrp/AsnC family transcriptional regulator n=1 Tax=Sphingomonas sp. TaxID=28214 RepID=UPI0025E1E0CC|nr:Lrp/AsnC family transcriptional regulator [Sphingomonas sp.]